MQLFDHVLRSKTTPPSSEEITLEIGLHTFNLSQRDVTLPVLLLLHLCLADGCKVLESLEQDEAGRRPTKPKK